MATLPLITSPHPALDSPPSINSTLQANITNGSLHEFFSPAKVATDPTVFGINTLSNTLAIQCQNCLALVNLPRTQENSQIHSHHLHIISRSQARKSSLIRTPRLSVLHQPHPHTPSQLLHPPNRYCTFEGHPHLPQSDNTASTQNCYCQRTGFVTRTPTSPQADHGPQQAESHPSPHHKPLSMANTRPDVATTMPPTST